MADNKELINMQEMVFEKMRRALYLYSVVSERAGIAARLGKSFGDERDLYDALGYPKTLKFENFLARYERQDIAYRVVAAPVDATWRMPPELVDTQEPDITELEKAWAQLVKKRRLYSYFRRVDRIGGVGQFGVLLLGFNDNKDLSEECVSASELLYLSPYDEGSVSIESYESDTNSERYNLPVMYKIKKTQNLGGTATKNTPELRVHWSRLIHVADGLDSNEILGKPRMKKVFNQLMNLELVTSGSAEMFWRGAFPGHMFSIDADVDPQTINLTAMQEELDNYIHGLQRYIRAQGVSATPLSMQVADPSNHVEAYVTLIAVATGIPKRILMGSERGELASTQDERAWMSTIDDRRKDYAEGIILRPFIDRLIKVGVLPPPVTEDGETDYDLVWEDVFALTEKEKAEVGKLKTEAVAKYAATPGADMVLPPEIFYGEILDFGQEQIDKIKDLLGNLLIDDVGSEDLNEEIDDELQDEGEPAPAR